jgi:DNA-binding MarR family transcriptional regulator
MIDEPRPRTRVSSATDPFIRLTRGLAADKYCAVQTTEGDADARTDVLAFEALARVLIGIAMESVEAAAQPVTLTQFRLLLVLDGLGQVPSSRLAAALGSNASSVTRLADKLVALGYLTRGGDEHNRSIVTVAVTGAGHQLVADVLAHRHHTLGTILDQLSPTERAAASRAATRVADLAAGRTPAVTGPVPL